MGEAIFVFGVAVVFCSGVIALAFDGVTRKLARELYDRYSPMRERDSAVVAAAKKARQERLDSYIAEYLTYGYDERSAMQRANGRMETEARAAEAVK